MLSLKNRFFNIAVVSFTLTSALLIAIHLSGSDEGLSSKASLSSSLTVTLSGGSNYRGRETRIFNNSIEFGQVSFTDPDLIDNGDAFIEKQYMVLEAIVEMEISGNGFSSGEVTAYRIIPTSESFEKVMTSGVKWGTANAIEIPFTPSTSKISEIQKDTTKMPLRFLYFINRTQFGTLVDTITLTVNVL